MTLNNSVNWLHSDWPQNLWFDSKAPSILSAFSFTSKFLRFTCIKSPSLSLISCEGVTLYKFVNLDRFQILPFLQEEIIKFLFKCSVCNNFQGRVTHFRNSYLITIFIIYSRTVNGFILSATVSKSVTFLFCFYPNPKISYPLFSLKA